MSEDPIFSDIRAGAGQNQQMTGAPSEDTDQPGHPSDQPGHPSDQSLHSVLYK